MVEESEGNNDELMSVSVPYPHSNFVKTMAKSPSPLLITK